MSWRRGQSYGQDLRDRVLAAPGTIHAVALRLMVSDSYVARVRSRRTQLGQTSARAQHNHVPPRLAGLEPALQAKIKATPDVTLAQLCQWVKSEHGVSVGITTLHKTLARLGLTLKKRRCMPPNRSEPMLRSRGPPGMRTNPALP